jgi:hypothetical protein
MKHLLVIIFTLGFFVQNTNAQNSKIVGSWLLTKVETDGEIEETYMVTEFTADGKMVMMGMEVASWKYNKKANSIEMESDFDKDFRGVAKILKLNADELILVKDNVKAFYQKLDFKSIATENEASGFFGTWEIENKNNPEGRNFITFKTPDELVYVVKNKNRQQKGGGGMWMFDKEDMILTMIGFYDVDMPEGESKITKLDDDSLELENSGKTYSLKKQKKPDNKIERLTFSQEDFYTEDGDFKYEADEEKLPWRRWDLLKKDLLNVKQLVYNYHTLIKGTEVFETKKLTANVQASMEEEGFNIDNIFNGYDSNERELEINENFSDPLYPLEGYTCRIVGKEQITTPAGTFDCTVLEVHAGLDLLKKVWMVNDKIGVFAKIIEENTDDMYGYYHIYELQEIKTID